MAFFLWILSFLRAPLPSASCFSLSRDAWLLPVALPALGCFFGCFC